MGCPALCGTPFCAGQAGDHGEELRDHGGLGHVTMLYRELVQVPLIVRSPRLAASAGPARIPEVVELLDVGPAILDELGFEDPRAHQGESFAPRMRAHGEWTVVRLWKRLLAGLSGDPIPGLSGDRAHQAFAELARKTHRAPVAPAHERAPYTARWHYLVDESGRGELYDNRRVSRGQCPCRAARATVRASLCSCRGKGAQPTIPMAAFAGGKSGQGADAGFAAAFGSVRSSDPQDFPGR